jgi:hypothetical protein
MAKNRKAPEDVPMKMTSNVEPSVVTTWGSTSSAVNPVYNPGQIIKR